VSFAAAERVVQSLLYEGYLLYPYRSSSLKNQKRWAFGTLYPEGVARAHGDASRVRTECLLKAETATTTACVCVAVRFLELPGAPAGGGVESAGSAVERCIPVDEVVLPLAAPRHFEWSAPPGEWRPGAPRLRATVMVTATELEPLLYRLAVEVTNTTMATLAEEPELCALGSVHTLLHCRGGVFVSLLDPPAPFGDHAGACRNVGTWPVLVGDDDSTMLSSPIILYDRPKIAAASPGDLFDATEIDEILTLRIRTLSDGERREMRTDPRARGILERTEALDAEGLLALHAVCRFDAPAAPRGRYAPGDRVVLRPAPGGDVLDLALVGEAATVLGIEEDVEGRVYYTVTVDADPGRDLGALGQPGHRFFFTEAELEGIP
jgi:hypothetical protein